MKPTMKSGLPVWELSVHAAERNGNGYIPKSAKYHCFSNGHSLCKRYCQDTDEYEVDIEVDIESGEILSRPEIACKVCFERWKILAEPPIKGGFSFCQR